MFFKTLKLWLNWDWKLWCVQVMLLKLMWRWWRWWRWCHSVVVLLHAGADWPAFCQIGLTVHPRQPGPEGRLHSQKLGYSMHSQPERYFSPRLWLTAFEEGGASEFVLTFCVFSPHPKAVVWPMKSCTWCQTKKTSGWPSEPSSCGPNVSGLLGWGWGYYDCVNLPVTFLAQSWVLFVFQQNYPKYLLFFFI